MKTKQLNKVVNQMVRLLNNGKTADIVKQYAINKGVTKVNSEILLELAEYDYSH